MLRRSILFGCLANFVLACGGKTEESVNDSGAHCSSCEDTSVAPPVDTSIIVDATDAIDTTVAADVADAGEVCRYVDEVAVCCEGQVTTWTSSTCGGTVPCPVARRCTSGHWIEDFDACLFMTCPDAAADVDTTCIPKTCGAPHVTCGVLDDGCGGTLDCGSCRWCATCGGGGIPNVCGGPLCTPRSSCVAAGTDCGLVGDGCGGILDCGTCPAGRVCVFGRCVTDPDAGADAACVPRTCAEANANCGVAGDGCGGTMDCGTCTPPEVCGSCSHPPNHCTLPD